MALKIKKQHRIKTPIVKSDKEINLELQREVERLRLELSKKGNTSVEQLKKDIAQRFETEMQKMREENKLLRAELASKEISKKENLNPLIDENKKLKNRIVELEKSIDSSGKKHSTDKTDNMAEFARKMAKIGSSYKSEISYQANVLSFALKKARDIADSEEFQASKTFLSENGFTISNLKKAREELVTKEIVKYEVRNVPGVGLRTFYKFIE